MMNRSIMNRQMFREGGSAFPDLSGDGKITQKDILMGRGVIPKPMQEGGMMAPQAEMMPPPPPPAAMMPPAPPPEAMMPPPPPQEEMMGVGGLQDESGIDPEMLEQFMAAAAQNFGDLETAEDYEEMINRLRGDQMPIAGRRQELAEFVGPEDAQRTPESVLAMVQPVLMLNEVDQGIGGLAQDQMMEPVTGDMAGGIMSTVAGVEEAPAPVNFRQGGAVQKFADTNANRVAGDLSGILESDLGKSFQERRDLYSALIPPVYGPEELAEEKRLTEGQMFFDLARAGLALTQPGKRSESLAQSLARAAQDSKVFENIGARTQRLKDLELKGKLEDRKVDIAALSAAEAEETARLKAKRDLSIKGLEYEPGLVTMLLDGVPVPEFTDTKMFKREMRAYSMDPRYKGRITYRKTGTDVGSTAKYTNFYRLTGGPVQDEKYGEMRPDITIDVSTPAGRAQADVLVEQYGYLQGKRPTDGSSKADIQTFIPVESHTPFQIGERKFDGRPVALDLNDPAEREIARILREDHRYLLSGDPSFSEFSERVSKDYDQIFLGSNAKEKRDNLLFDSELIAAYANGTLDEIQKYKGTSITGRQVAGRILSAAQNAYRKKPVKNEETGIVEMKSELPVPDSFLAAVESRKKLGLEVPQLDPNQNVIRPRYDVDPNLYLDKQTRYAGDLDLTQSYAFNSGFNRLINNLGGQIESVLGGFGVGGEPFVDTIYADAKIKLTEKAIFSLLRADNTGKIFKADVDKIKETVQDFQPGLGNTPRKALAAVEEVQKSLLRGLGKYYDILNNPEKYPDGATRQAAREQSPLLEDVIGELEAIKILFRKNLDIPSGTVQTSGGTPTGGSSGPPGLGSRRGPTKTIGTGPP